LYTMKMQSDLGYTLSLGLILKRLSKKSKNFSMDKIEKFLKKLSVKEREWILLCMLQIQK
jgi:hypothetical protein